MYIFIKKENTIIYYNRKNYKDINNLNVKYNYNFNNLNDFIDLETELLMENINEENKSIINYIIEKLKKYI